MILLTKFSFLESIYILNLRLFRLHNYIYYKRDRDCIYAIALLCHPTYFIILPISHLKISILKFYFQGTIMYIWEIIIKNDK